MITEKEKLALEILREARMDVVEAAILAREVARIGRGNIKRARRCLELGEKELCDSERTVSFARAVAAGEEERQSRRARTVSDFRYVTRRFMRACPGLARRRVRGVKPKECAEWIEQAFSTDAQRKKARAILSGVFSTAVRRGWCAENPVRLVAAPKVVEREIPILSKDEINRLIDTASRYENGICLPAVGLMLYAGIRPHEVARLGWDAVDMAMGCIRVRPQHSKTGGARCVSIQPPLAALLKASLRARKARGLGAAGRICPRNWKVHWARLHKKAGFTHWQPDVLRHTFASHHLARFRSYAELQLEMGHRSAELLRTRYVNMPPRSIF